MCLLDRSINNLYILLLSLNVSVKQFCSVKFVFVINLSRKINAVVFQVAMNCLFQASRSTRWHYYVNIGNNLTGSVDGRQRGCLPEEVS